MNRKLMNATRFVVVVTMLFTFNGFPALAAIINTDAGTSSIEGLLGGGLDDDGNRIFAFTGDLDLTDRSNTITGSRGLRIQATGNIIFDTPFFMGGAAGNDGGNQPARLPQQFGGGLGGNGMLGNDTPNFAPGGSESPHGLGPASKAEPLAGGTNGANDSDDDRDIFNNGFNGDNGGGGGGGSHGGSGGRGGDRDRGFGRPGVVFGDPDIRGAGTLSGGGGGGGGGSGWGGASGGNGGGALALEAGGDLTIGAKAVINVTGGRGGEWTGNQGVSAGGGGSGGSILLSGQNVDIDGLASLLADGGAGGLGVHFSDPLHEASDGFTGGGGGGGRIAVYADTGDIIIDNEVVLAEGDNPLTFEDGDDGDFRPFSTVGGIAPENDGGDDDLAASGLGGSLYLQPATPDILLGDLFPDGFVDSDDLFVLLANWGTLGGPALGDLFDDPDPAKAGINADDLFVLLANWTGPDPGPGGIAALADTAVPEPSTLLLALLGFAGLVGLRRRRNRA